MTGKQYNVSIGDDGIMITIGGTGFWYKTALKVHPVVARKQWFCNACHASVLPGRKYYRVSRTHVLCIECLMHLGQALRVSAWNEISRTCDRIDAEVREFLKQDGLLQSRPASLFPEDKEAY